jgi:type I restriction enzyme S subunit
MPLGESGPLQQGRIAKILLTTDEAIEQTKMLIAKHQQIKAGLMHDLFTRGLTPDVRLRPPHTEAPHLYKDSPFGPIPKEWEAPACREICLSVIDCKNRTPPLTPEGHPVIRTPNVRGGRLVWKDLAYTDEASYLEWTARGKPQPGDIVITREAPVGEVCILPEELENPCLGQRIMLYRSNPDRVLNSYLLYALQSRSVQLLLDRISGGSTVGHVRVGDIRDLLVPWAQFSEQEAIAERLEAACSHLTAEEHKLSKLQSLKRGLMHDLLTGKVPVPIPAADTDA